MTIDEHIEFWYNQSNEDLNTSIKMYESGIFDWSLFVAHLALEKLLKAAWIKQNNNPNPPKIHNLVKLANSSNIKLTKEREKLYLIINNFQLEARYQSYKDNFKKITTKEFTDNYIKLINKKYLWIKSQLT